MIEKAIKKITNMTPQIRQEYRETYKITWRHNKMIVENKMKTYMAKNNQTTKNSKMRTYRLRMSHQKAHT